MENEAKVFQDMFSFVRNMLFTFSQTPKLMAKVIQCNNNVSISGSVENLVETLTNTFYDCITEETFYQKNLLKFIAELLVVEITELEKPSMLFHSSSLAEKIIISYTKRQECQNFKKTLLKNAFTAIQKENSKIELDDQKIYEVLIERRNKEHSIMSSDRNSQMIASMPVNIVRSSVSKQEIFKKASSSGADTSSIGLTGSTLAHHHNVSQSVSDLKIPRQPNQRKNSTLYYMNILQDHDSKNEEEVPVYETTGQPGIGVRKSIVPDASANNLRDSKSYRKRTSMLSEAIYNDLTFLNDKSRFYFLL